MYCEVGLCSVGLLCCSAFLELDHVLNYQINTKTCMSQLFQDKGCAWWGACPVCIFLSNL